MKKRTSKGFTLIELIIVMAVFSIIMLGAMSLVDPVTKINTKASTNERTSAYVDNIQNYLQGSLQYADNLWVYQGTLPSDTKDLAFNYKEAFYHNIVNTKNGITVNYAKCKIRVMTILNSDSTIGGVDFKKGQIVMQDVDYSSDEGTAKALSAPSAELNDVFFSDKYAFDYVLGQGNFVKDGTNSMELDNMKAANIASVAKGMNENNFSLGILLYDDSRDDAGDPKFYTNNSSTYDLVAGDGSVTKADIPYTFRTFTQDAAAAYYVANIPLLNIISRSTTGKLNKSYYVYHRVDETTEDTTKCDLYPGVSFTGEPDHPSMGHTAFECIPDNISMSADDNIVIVYSLASEVNIPQ